MTKLSAYFAFALLVVLISVLGANGQVPALGDVTSVGAGSCPSSNGFYSPGANYPTTCWQGIVTCGDDGTVVAPLQINWSVANVGSSKGTIVMFSGGAGTSASESPGEEAAFVPGYLTAGYTVIQTAWAGPWEVSDDGSGTYTDNVRYAACRPATFLNYV